MNPDDAREAQHLLRAMQDQDVRVTATLMADSAIVRATDANGEVHEVTRDDMDLLAAVVEVDTMLGWEFT